MPDNQETAAATANTGGVKADWSALQELTDVVVEQPKAKVDVTEDAPKQEEINLEETKPEDKPADKPETEATKEEVKPEAKKEETKEEPKEEGELEFKLEDLKDLPKEYQEGTFQALAKDLGYEIPEESFDAFKEAFVPKSELEKVKQITLDSVLADVKPEVAVAIKLIQEGMSPEQVLAPNAAIDEFLRMDDASIVRKDFEEQGILSTEIIDNKMEQLAAEPQKLKLMADELRAYLNQAKKENIEHRNHLLQKFEQDKQKAISTQKIEERTNIKNALNNASSFMGVPLSKEIKDAIAKKYDNGAYDNDLSNPAQKAELILQKELGEKLIKHIQNKASAKAEKEVRDKLLNIPPVNGGTGKKVDTSKQPKADNPWGALEELKT